MLDRLTRLVKHAAIYGMGGVVNRATAFLLLPLYTNFLTPSDYGILEILNIITRFLGIFLLMGLGSAIFKSTLYDNPFDKRIALSTMFYFLLFSSTAIISLLFLLSPQLAALLLDVPSYASLLRITLLSSWLGIISTIPLVRLRVEEKSFAYSFLSWFQLVVTITLNIYFVAGLKAGLRGLVLAGLISAGIYTSVSWVTFTKQLTLNFSGSILGSMLSFGLPLIPVRVSLTVLDLVDRFFLRHYFSLDEVGLYSVGYKFGMMIVLVVTSLQMAWPTIMFSVAKTERANVFYARVLTYYLLGTSYLGLAISLLSRDAIRVITPADFHSAYQVVPLIVLAYIAYGLYYITAVGVNLKGKTQYLIITAGGSAFLHLGLNFILIPKYGMMGAGISTAISYVSFGIFSWILSLKLYRINYEYRRLLILSTLALLCYVLGNAMNFQGIIPSIMYRGLCLVFFPVALYLIGFFQKEEKATLVRIMKQTITKINTFRF